ncbi:bifunctional 2-C-methyl-D-erythritol 4-phosphate cytidylyltransferase/2-C-methyl-D-erythritol 2,4-cyclodiphosphate synthase [uncultured Algimonas sp.]|uniref:bifunctional 2-C-methyl-D-erythritol 4-phosphate cytidylyltransferase/2-C-methyl-D-erythritol 2,4-cyclodiphosphate synthase n=1 Tax=uncultured Algimonas sp. TaxID=1547920 RepID=UPI00260A6E8B|nr:bifunctional 2-C-methyl-D-erythritol 4-phosphate cytidylyltransferase/2-C-methyl-D-erythritol 2,4-cyclodiphosphate synthase [uncultured Algimonas sp.]
MTDCALILVAAGRGERARGKVPKQYKLLRGQPLLAHTLKHAADTQIFSRTVLVVAAGDRQAGDLAPEAVIVTGGATRTASVRAGLDALSDDPPDIVMIHDAARPFIDATLVRPLLDALRTHDGAVPALPIVDALKTDGFDAVDRNVLHRVQTPQAFRYGPIKAAFDALPLDVAAHDDIAVARDAGLSLAFTPGSDRNFKVTWPEDFAKAEAMLRAPTLTVTGSGFDVHKLAESDDPLWLCGVEVESRYTLVGHSDADVGLHAITDAILGAVAQGDIGDHFPPDDPQWKGAASDRFLQHAIHLAQDQGATLRHVDLTIICERPKVKPYREAMRARVAEITGLPFARVSIKATTTETLGFTGRREGIAAQALATLEVPE